MTKPMRPEFPRPATEMRYGSLLSMQLQYLAWQRYDSQMLAHLGVISKEDTKHRGVVIIPDQDHGEGGYVLLPTPLPVDVWEKIAGWQQKPHRELDPSTAEFSDAQADQLEIFHGEDNPSVLRLRAEAERRRQNPPPAKPTDPVRIASERDQVDNTIAIQSDDDRERAISTGKAIKRGIIRSY